MPSKNKHSEKFISYSKNLVKYNINLVGIVSIYLQDELLV